MECGKLKYKNRGAAQRAIRGVNNDKKKRRKKWPMKSCYYCKDCKAWHLTSKHG